MKQFQTKEECLEVMGEHCFEQHYPNAGLSCLVDHNGGHCSYNDPVRRCRHCGYTEREELAQEEVKIWKAL